MIKKVDPATSTLRQGCVKVWSELEVAGERGSLLRKAAKAAGLGVIPAIREPQGPQPTPFLRNGCLLQRLFPRREPTSREPDVRAGVGAGVEQG